MVNAGAMVGEVLDTAMGVTLEYVFPYDIAYFFLCPRQVQDVVECIWKALVMGN